MFSAKSWLKILEAEKAPAVKANCAKNFLLLFTAFIYRRKIELLQHFWLYLRNEIRCDEKSFLFYSNFRTNNRGQFNRGRSMFNLHKTASQLGEKPAKGMNSGILYLMFAPLAIGGFIGFRWWQRERRLTLKRLIIFEPGFLNSVAPSLASHSCTGELHSAIAAQSAERTRSDTTKAR